MTLLEQLVAYLKAGKRKDSPEVVVLLATIKSQQPDQLATAESIVRDWPQSALATLSPQTLGIGTLGIAGVAGLPYAPAILQWLSKNVQLPNVTSPFLILIVIALVGAIAGACYSLYIHRGLVLPEFTKDQHKILLTQLGILNEIGFGALAASTSIWTSVIGLTSIPGGDPQTVATVGPDVNLLSWSVILGSLVSGWFGARMRSARLDQSMLQSVLADVSALPAGSQGLKTLIKSAPSATVAAQLATGKEIIGTRPKALEYAEAKRASELWKLLDRKRVQEELGGKAIGFRADGAGLTVGMLRGLNSLDPILANLIMDFSLVEIAQISDDEFAALVGKKGFATPEVTPLLHAIRKSSSQTMHVLSQLPSDWVWPGKNS